MATLGTSRLLLGCGLVLGLALSGCSKHENKTPGTMAGASAGESGRAGSAGAGTIGGAGSSGDTGGTAGTSGGMGASCDERGCWVSKEVFQGTALKCPDDYDKAQDEFQNQPGEECSYAFFDCGGLKGAAHQYGFTGDNVQCYYDDGALVGGVRTSDHGPSTLFGEVPSPGCYVGPDCDDAGVGSDGGAGDGGTADPLRSCQVNSDCVIAATTCCPCGRLSADQVTSVRRDRQAQHSGRICALPIACTDVECPISPPLFVASCVEGVCSAVEIGKHPSTECESADDCRVRGTTCCECGTGTDPGALIATSDENAFSSLVCDPQQGCPECSPVYPAEATVSCNASNHCELTDPRGDL